MNDFVLETTRFVLREFSPKDAVGLYQLNLHPDIFRFTTDPPFESVEDAEKFIYQYDAYSKSGFGRWAVIWKQNQLFAGWCGLKYNPTENEVDIGYRLLPEYWGQGIAVETAGACCNMGFNEFGLRRIVARIHKQNMRSVRVAAKLGMQYECDLIYDGVAWLNYVINHPEPSSTAAKKTFQFRT